MKRVLTIAALAIGLTAVESKAEAFEVGAAAMPSAYVLRPLTLMAGQLRLDGGPPDHGLLNSGFRNSGRGFRVRHVDDLPGDDTGVSLGLGAGYGITDEFEVGVFLLPIRISPDFDFGNIEFYGRFTFLNEGSVMVAAQAGIGLPTGEGDGLGTFFLLSDGLTLTLGVPVALRLNEGFRIETGGEMELILGNNTQIHIDVPAAFLFQLTDVMYLGPTTGLLVVDGDELAIGAGVTAGFTILQNEAPLMDLVAALEFPYFLWTGGLFDSVNLDIFTLTFGARVFFTVL